MVPGAVVALVRQHHQPGGAQLGECLAFAQVGQGQEGLLGRDELAPGEPICTRWRRMIPAV